MHVQSLLTVTGIFCSLVTGLPVQAQRSGSGGVANRLPKLQELPQARPEPQPALPPAVEYEVKARYWRKYPIKEVAGKPKGPPVHHEIFWPHNDNFQKDQRLVDCVMENLDLKFGVIKTPPAFAVLVLRRREERTSPQMARSKCRS